MKLLKQLLILTTFCLFVYACGSSAIKKNTTQKEEPVVIANDSLEYEVIIIDIGFNAYLNSVAQPRNYYSQSYLETRNRIYVNSWNVRAQNPTQYDSSIYENIVDYQPNIDYGYEVNYLLFNYFLFAQQKYNMNLNGGFRGRIR